MENNQNDIKKDKPNEAVIRGKKAIEAEKKILGEDPSDPATKDKEKRDAEKWRNEG